MNSQTLREARKYEEASEKMISADHRPAYGAVVMPLSHDTGVHQ